MDIGDIAKYYDEWTSKYQQVYGNIIQAYRPSSNEELLDYTIASAALADGQRIIDAGCGICGPAIHFGSRLDVQIDACTISPTQVDIARKAIEEHQLLQKVHVREGDFHDLDDLYSTETYDRVLFLESLGHALRPDDAIDAAHNVLRPGGQIYIKDFFPIETTNPALEARVQRVVAAINRLYTYNVLDLHKTLTKLRQLGFHIISIKRPEYESDVGIRAAFETQFGIDIFDGEPEFMPAEWLEIRCERPTWING